MASEYFGTEQMIEEDRAYRGSRFSEVRDALFANPYQKVWGGAGEPPLPIYGVSVSRVLRGILPFGQPYYFRQAVERTLDSHADLRWGTDGKGFRRLIHPNGVCLTGLWEITEETAYSGYFATGSKALLVGRYSSSNSNTRRGQTRSTALVGKLFPTTDPDHAEPLRTANFFTQQALTGEHTDYLNEAQFTNAPETHPGGKLMEALIGVVSIVLFMRVDKQATIRQLYPIAELGKPEGEPTRAPEFMRLKAAPGQPRIEGEALDLRDEALAHLFDQGDPTPKRTLTFDIEVTDEGSTRGKIFQRRSFGTWRRIGRITFDDAVASYNGDFVLHFNHPTWRDDRNDPATATRVNGRKVR